MPQSDNLYYYIVYGVILIAFVVVLKSPKKSVNENKDDEEK